MLMNHVHDCLGKYVFFIVQMSLSLKTKILWIFQMYDFAPMKNSAGVQGRSKYPRGRAGYHEK